MEKYSGIPSNRLASPIDYAKAGLDPWIWQEDGKLNPLVRQQILNKLENFYKSKGIGNYGEWTKDIIIVGSIASYNYSSYSDVDNHIVVDSEKFTHPFEMADEVWRKEINDDELVQGTHHHLEFYWEFEPQERSNGVYSILEDRWLKLPPQAYDDPEVVAPDVMEYARQQSGKFDKFLGDVKRESFDIELLLESIQSLGQEEAKQFLKKMYEKIKMLEGEIKALSKESEELRNKRKEDFSQLSPANLTMKYLQKYGYLRVVSRLEKLLEDDGRITPEEIKEIRDILSEEAGYPSGRK